MENSYVLQLQEPKFKEFYLSYSGYAQCEPLHCYGPASRPHYLIHFVLKGKGFKSVSGNWKGDFVFTVHVQVPKKLTAEQKELITKLALTMNEQPPIKRRGIFG